MNWKDAYKDQWGISNAREAFVSKAIKDATGLETRNIGFGAGSTRYIPGSARANGYDKGGADLQVGETNVHVEVTGTDKPISAYADIWIRPDKITSAREKLGKASVWFAHVLDHMKLIRVIHLNEEFLARCDRKEFQTRGVFIRGNQEHFTVIPARDQCLKALSALTSVFKAGRV